MALEGARGPDTEQRPHPEAKIESTGMNEQSFEHVLMPAHVRPPEPTGLGEMRTRSLEQFPASAEEAFSTIPVDPPSIRVDRISFGFLVRLNGLQPSLGCQSGKLHVGSAFLCLPSNGCFVTRRAMGEVRCRTEV
jgi:hypothetical protein